MSHATAPRARMLGLDAVRAFAVIGVITIHADHWPLQASGIDRTVWQAVDLLARATVPLFVMLSGFLLSTRPPSAGSWRGYLSRRVSRSLVPWLVWTPVYAVAGIFLTNEVPASWSGLAAWLSLGAGHLWFLLLIPQLYLLFLAWPARPRAQAAVTVVAVLIQVALSLYRFYAPANGPLNGFFLAHGYQLFPFWIGYFAVGAALGSWFARGRPAIPAWPFWAAAVPAAALLLASPIAGAANAEFAQGTGAFLRPDLLPLAVVVFLALALGADRVLAPRPLPARAISLVSRCSLGIYIVHEALLYIPGRLLSGVLLQRGLPLSLAGVLLLVAATLALALLAARLIAATPLALTIGQQREPMRPATRDPGRVPARMRFG
jgi:probable poly-beta-1,6-N-acetyl-D-glucosamine export protein